MIETPDHYKRMLKRFGGVNDFGDANFILLWGETRTIKDLAVPQPFIAPYFNCWILAEWRPAADFGHPDDWPRELGPYPSRGGYVPLAVFRTPKGEPVMLDTVDLNPGVLQMWVYLTLKHEHDRLALRKQVFDADRERKEAAKVRRIADLLHDAYPSFGTAEGVSFFGQANCNSVVKQKMDEIERRMPAIRNFFKRVPKGMSVHKM